METLNTQLEKSFVSDYAVLLKKMRLLRRLNRGQASLLLDFSFKNLERLENGRGNISAERFREFQEKYGFSDQEIDDLRSGKIQASTDANSIRRKSGTKNRPDRRFCHRRITRECKVLNSDYKKVLISMKLLKFVELEKIPMALLKMEESHLLKKRFSILFYR